MLRNLNFGDTICDMHDGYDFEKLPGATITNMITLDYPNGASIIESLVRNKTGDANWKYHNKHLVIVGETFDGITLSFSWDGVTLHFITVLV